MIRPLDGILVVALEQAVAAPLATRMLADQGARVVKVERPGVGDFARHYDDTVGGQAGYFVWLNRGKESVELDIKAPADRAVLDGLLAKADVLVQNLLPGAMDRLGLDAATLHRTNPGLIHVGISGYGEPGPYSGRKAYDLLVQCESGLVEATGTPEAGARVGVSIADIATGLYAQTGVLAALLRRARTGEGATLEVTMLDALAEIMSQPYHWTRDGGRDWKRTGTRHPTLVPYGTYPTGGDGQVLLCVQSDKEWGVLCRDVLARPDLVDDPRFARNIDRVHHEPEVAAVLTEVFAVETAEQVRDRLDAAGIANAIVRTPLDAAAHPQLLARDRWREVRHPGGVFSALLPPFTALEWDAVMGEVPALGAHTDAVRREILGP